MAAVLTGRNFLATNIGMTTTNMATATVTASDAEQCPKCHARTTAEQQHGIVRSLSESGDGKVHDGGDACCACTATFTDARLYWDDQDPKNTGWVLRWRERGLTESTEIGEDEDASIETLAHQAADCAPGGATGDVAVYRGDVKRGRITLRDGAIAVWRAP